MNVTKKIVFVMFCWYVLGILGNPKISIITSLYKGDYFIEGFLQDITQQTIFDQCELIIINANSPGNEEPVIRYYMQRYPNIIYTRLKSDPGLYGVWNRAIKIARGEYITNANVDDRLAYNCYEVHARVLDSKPYVDLLYSDFYRTTYPNKDFDYIVSTTQKVDLNIFKKNQAYCIKVGEGIWHCHELSFSKQALKRRCLPNNHPMWRKSLHNRYGLFNERFKSASDWEFWLRIALQGAFFEKVPGVYAVFYINPQGLSYAKNERHKAEVNAISNKYKNI